MTQYFGEHVLLPSLEFAVALRHGSGIPTVIADLSIDRSDE
jgi:hypothetical protein